MIQQTITEPMLHRWFADRPDGQRLGYAQRLARSLGQQEILALHDVLEAQLLGRTVPWASTVAVVSGCRS